MSPLLLMEAFTIISDTSPQLCDQRHVRSKAEAMRIYLGSLFSDKNFFFQQRGRVFLVLSLLVVLLTLSISAQAQANPLRIRKTVVGGLTQVDTNQVFQYRITASCNNLTTTCGNLTLTDTLPAGITLL